MEKKDNLRLKIASSNLAEKIKIFLLLNIDKFDEEQVDWLLENL
jgi:hypothetical protein